MLSGKLKTQTLKDILICSELLRMILVSMFVLQIVADFKTRKKVNFTIGLTFVNIAVIVLELKKG